MVLTASTKSDNNTERNLKNVDSCLHYIYVLNNAKIKSNFVFRKITSTGHIGNWTPKIKILIDTFMVTIYW